MTYKPISSKPMLKGLNACTDYATQPPGSFPRGSDFLLNKRGALDVCDGTQLIHAFNGQVQAGRGKMLAVFLFSPTGVSNYYLALAQALDLPIGNPFNLTLVTAAGGTLPAATYFYVVTAVDGVGGETIASPEASIVTGAAGKNTLTWNIVPNAGGYNVYRGTVGGGETLLLGKNMPVSQVGFGSLTVSFVDDGTDPNVLVVAVASAVINEVDFSHGAFTYIASFTLVAPQNIPNGLIFNYVPGSDANFAQPWTVQSVVSPTQFVAKVTHLLTPLPLLVGETTIGGNFSIGVAPPIADSTQQIVLFKMPVISGSPASLPVSYNNSNIVAVFPALLTTFASVGGGGGGSGGGGGTGGGGSGGPGGGRPINTF
jgi:hypothetical protein